MGNIEEQRTYAEFVREEDDETDKAIRRATKTGRLFGTDQFIDHLEFRLSKPLKPSVVRLGLCISPVGAFDGSRGMKLKTL